MLPSGRLRIFSAEVVGSRRVVRSLPVWRGGLIRVGSLAPSQSAAGFRLFGLVGRRVMERRR